jgi:histidine phosphotransferase ChpT
MNDDRAALAALVGSRLCHDLISPIGAIQNGLELVSLAGEAGGTGAEMALIQDSCDNASARIRFFRIAFGSATDAKEIGAQDVIATFEGLNRSGRVKADWQITERLPRSEVQFAFLGYMCVENALPLGGTVTITRKDGVLHIHGTGPRIRANPETWDLLAGTGAIAQVTAAEVQFALLSTLARDRGVRILAKPGEEATDIAIGERVQPQA